MLRNLQLEFCAFFIFKIMGESIFQKEDFKLGWQELATRQYTQKNQAVILGVCMFSSLR